MTENSNFDPKELEYISKRMTEIVEGENEGYEMVFYVSQNDVEELLDNYNRAERQEPKAIIRCWMEYKKIMLALQEAVMNADDDDD